MRLQKMNKRKLWLSKVIGSSRSSHKSDSSNGDDIPRLISFGNMPSYRYGKVLFFSIKQRKRENLILEHMYVC